ncbi:MAG: hypothetical protein ACTTGX_00030 [Candidatus Cryptobacteroides sp.]
MKRLFKILLTVTVVAATVLACKKTQPEKPKQEQPSQQEATFVLEATVSGEAKYDGSGDLSYTVKSIRKIDNKEEFLPWSMEFSMDGGNTWKAEKPEFLTLTTKEENGDLTAKTYTATFAAQEKTLQTSDIILKAKPVLSNVDLSMVNIKGEALANKNTANCYVIHNPGTYKFPTVYGNSIKNGTTNTKAYTSTKTGPNILTKFLKADGTEITKPEIEGIKDACLIWQDTKDLISNISFDSANQYVKFEVKKETIHNGNAIIAVRDASNTILWSWHIWVTEEDLTPVEITNKQNVKYSLLPVNLGWCSEGEAIDYAQREVMVRIKQSNSNKIVEVALTQTGYCEGDRKAGNCTFYQWGRKDPMLGKDGTSSNKDKECFTTDAQYKFVPKGLNTADIKEYIKYPYKFNVNSDMDGKYYNLWNVDNERVNVNDDDVVKTVYDPSPVGYTVTAPNTFTGFTRSGQNSGNSSEWNVQGSFDKGWHFYCKPNKQGHTLFFPACGCRNNRSGALTNVSTYGCYWAAGPNYTYYGRRLGFYSGYISTLDDTHRSYGHSVRPAQEK